MKFSTQSIQDMPEGSVVSGELVKIVFKLQSSKNLALLLNVENNQKPPYRISVSHSMFGKISGELMEALGGIPKCRLILSKESEIGFEPEILAIGHEWLDSWVSLKPLEKENEQGSPEQVRHQLAYINSKRALFGQPSLDPIKSGWDSKDIDIEARRLHWSNS
jgi:hypothetical protein